MGPSSSGRTFRRNTLITCGSALRVIPSVIGGRGGCTAWHPLAAESRVWTIQAFRAVRMRGDQPSSISGWIWVRRRRCTSSASVASATSQVRCSALVATGRTSTRTGRRGRPHGRGLFGVLGVRGPSRPPRCSYGARCGCGRLGAEQSGHSGRRCQQYHCGTSGQSAPPRSCPNGARGGPCGSACACPSGPRARWTG